MPDPAAGLDQVLRELVQANHELVQSNRELVAVVRELVGHLAAGALSGAAGASSGRVRRIQRAHRRTPQGIEKERARKERWRAANPGEWRQRRPRRRVRQGAPPAPCAGGAGTPGSSTGRPGTPGNSTESLSGGIRARVAGTAGAVDGAGTDRVAQVAQLIAEAGVPLVMTDADRRAVHDCSAPPGQIAEAFAAAARGEWTGGDTWLRQNLSIRVVVQRLSGYLATRSTSSRTASSGPNRTIGAVNV